MNQKFRAAFPWENRYVKTVYTSLHNYYGYSTNSHNVTFSASGSPTGSKAQDLSQPGLLFDPSTQLVGSTNVKAKTGSDLTLTTVDASGKITALRPLDGSAAGSGVLIRYFAQDAQPTLNDKEICVWWDTDGAAVYLLVYAGAVYKKVQIS
jgi:hypothetical protein